MLNIKYNVQNKINHMIIRNLTCIKRYKFETVVLPTLFINTKLPFKPLIMGYTLLTKVTILARSLCILLKKRISTASMSSRDIS